MPSSTSSSRDVGSRFLPGLRPRRIAHRGLALDGAENTMRAFEDALAHGADMIETDTRPTADGTALAFHDATLIRVVGQDRPVTSVRDEELEHLRTAGDEPLARLEDVLGTFTDVPINIDVKAAEAIAPTARAVARTRAANRICVTSFDDRVARSAIEAIRSTTGVVPVRSPSRAAMARFLSAVSLEAPQRLISGMLKPYGALQVPASYRGVPVVTPRSIAAAHRAGCEVHVWTIDEVEEMSALLRMGVDGIITNRVDLLARLLAGDPTPTSTADHGTKESSA